MYLQSATKVLRHFGRGKIRISPLFLKQHLVTGGGVGVGRRCTDHSAYAILNRGPGISIIELGLNVKELQEEVIMEKRHPVKVSHLLLTFFVV